MRSLERARLRREFKKEKIMRQEEIEKKILETGKIFIRQYSESESENEEEDEPEYEYETEAELENSLSKLSRKIVSQLMVNCIENLFKHFIEPKYDVRIKFVEEGNFKIIHRMKIIGEIKFDIK